MLNNGLLSLEKSPQIILISVNYRPFLATAKQS